ncbi:MAG: TatD family hydrolase [Puniceicoccales bacterium]|jgi:TatD DNase family protein|nr:TatD family hydrolase [Puniceicoccales bacterium]
MNLIDTHCHLDGFCQKNIIDNILQRASNAEVTHLVTCGTEESDWQVHAELSSRYNNIDYTVGIHPTNVNNNFESSLEVMYRYLSNNKKKPVAIGEIGLDYFKISERTDDVDATIKLQKLVLEQQLLIAKTQGLPVIIHARAAFADSVDIIEKSGVDWHRVVFHCFSEGPAEIKKLNQRGGVGSITGTVTYKKADNVRESVIAQGLDKLMIETDCPFLPPAPFQGKQNEPAYLREIAKFCATILGTTEQEVCAVTTRNALAFFSIDIQ